jgi:hypothetical protein
MPLLVCAPIQAVRTLAAVVKDLLFLIKKERGELCFYLSIVPYLSPPPPPPLPSGGWGGAHQRQRVCEYFGTEPESTGTKMGGLHCCIRGNFDLACIQYVGKPGTAGAYNNHSKWG